MAGANKRTTCALATVVVIFIIVIIILCLVPDPCRRHDPRPECKGTKGYFAYQQTTSTAGPSTTVRTTSTRRKQTELPTTSPDPPTSTSTFSSSTSSVSSTWSTEESLLEQDTYGTDSTYSTESSLFADEDGTTTPVSDLTETTTVVEAFDNETKATDSFNMTTEFGGDSTTEMFILDYNVTGGDSTTEMYILDYNVTTTDVISTTLELNATANVTEMPTTTEIEMSTDVSITETAETATETELSTTMTAEVTNSTESSTKTLQSTTEAHLYPASLRPPVALKGVCDTEVCTEVARRMLDMMDPGDVDPCDDFYQYSCGGVLDDPFLKPEDPQVFADKIIKEAITYGPKDDEELEKLFVTYASCLNYRSFSEAERLTRVREVLEELGYQFSPLTGSDFDLGDALLKMMKRHFTPFFDINIDIPQDEEGSLSLKMVLPTAASAFTNERAKDICVAEYKAKEYEAKYNKLAFDINSQYEDYVNCTKHGQGLRERMKHIQRSIDHLGLLDDKGNAISEDVKNQATGALEKMLEDLAEATPPIPERRGAPVHKEYEEFTLADIDDKAVLGHLPFKMSKFIQDLLDIQINEPHYFKIQVYAKDAFIKLFKIIFDLHKRPNPLMQNIMMLLWVEHIYDDLISPVGAPPGSLDYCFHTVTKLMDDYVSYLYLKTIPERDTLESQMRRMIDLTVELMKSKVETSGLEFGDDFKEELNKMKGEFAILDEAKALLLENKNYIETSKVGNNFTENYIILMKNYRDRLYHIFKEESINYRTLWSFLQFPYRHTGVTSYGLNTFLIPHGAMSPPYYYEDAPSYINYAGVGNMIAHELLHSFDFKGMKLNGEANSATTRAHMLTKNRDCLSQQLSNISSIHSSKGLMYNFKLLQNLHLDELLADVAGPNLAWNAYNKDLTYNSTPAAVTTTPPPMPHYYYSGIISRRRRSATSVSAASRNASHVLVTTDPSLHEKHLVHWEDKTIQQIYFIKTAQNQCSSASGLDVLEVMENENLPPKLRVNLGLGNNKMFMKAFNCDRKSNPKMKPQAGVCFYNPTGHD